MSARFAATFVAVLALAGCGDDDDDGEGAAKPVGYELGGSVVQVADCGDWREGTEAERRATIEELKGQLTPQTDATPESALSDDRAYEILQNTCRTPRFESLRLYKLYTRAQGFAPLDAD